MTPTVFDWSNSENGRLLATMGILSALLQGGYTRNVTRKIGEGVMARRGVISCAIGFVLIAILPQLQAAWASRVIYAAAVFLAFTSATVVSSLTSLASLQCDEEVSSDEMAPLAKGRALGQFRSKGQLGRAIGPILGTFSCKAATPSHSFLQHVHLIGRSGRQ
jgi:MFS family permease